RPYQALGQILAGEIRLVDLPFANGRPFLNVASIGWATMAGYRMRGKGIEITVDVDGHATTGRASMMAIGNCRHVGSGIEVCPQAYFDDGLFDVCVAEELSWTGKWLARFHLARGN